MNWSGRKALVTGGAGFVPSHIVDALVERGAEVTVLDNMQAGREENLAAVRDSIRFTKGDVRDPDTVHKAIAGQEFVFHLAANASVPLSVRDPRYDFETNALGTFNVLAAAKDVQVHRVVYASSAAIYGEPQYVPVDEKHPLLPSSFYGESKLAGEKLGMMFHKMYGLGFSCIRIFNTYGPRQPRYVIADLIRKLQKNPRSLKVLGTGEQIRDYCYCTDTAGAFVAAAENEDMNGGAYNISGGNPVSIRDLVTTLLRVMNLPECDVSYTGESWQGDISHLEADIGRIREAGFAPTIGLEEGLHLTLDSGTIVGESEF